MYGEFNERYEPTDIDAYRRKILLQGSEFQIDILGQVSNIDIYVRY
jgi:hypothetical protein